MAQSGQNGSYDTCHVVAMQSPDHLSPQPDLLLIAALLLWANCSLRCCIVADSSTTSLSSRAWLLCCCCEEPQHHSCCCPVLCNCKELLCHLSPGQDYARLTVTDLTTLELRTLTGDWPSFKKGCWMFPIKTNHTIIRVTVTSAW